MSKPRTSVLKTEHVFSTNDFIEDGFDLCSKDQMEERLQEFARDFSDNMTKQNTKYNISNSRGGLKPEADLISLITMEDPVDPKISDKRNSDSSPGLKLGTRRTSTTATWANFDDKTIK
jgi:hypothetical protein